jgi:hypothetical protein
MRGNHWNISWRKRPAKTSRRKGVANRARHILSLLLRDIHQGL